MCAISAKISTSTPWPAMSVHYEGGGGGGAPGKGGRLACWARCWAMSWWKRSWWGGLAASGPGKLLPSSSLSKMLLGMVEAKASLMLKPLSCSDREAVGGPPAMGGAPWDTVAEAPPW